MNAIRLLMIFGAATASFGQTPAPQPPGPSPNSQYRLGPDSMPQEGVPKGEMGGAILPDMLRWLWRDEPVSTDPNDLVERSFRQPAKKPAQ
ncbi:MAG TPA: hypothetical protein VL967_06615 [Terracidiphilus sp.]|nr:hypothetical protein [Terracidiphilus sp.]